MTDELGSCNGNIFYLQSPVQMASLSLSTSCPDLKAPGSYIEDDCKVITIPVPDRKLSDNKERDSVENNTKNKVKKVHQKEMGKYIDRISRIAFPVTFLTVNIFYWTLLWI